MRPQVQGKGELAPRDGARRERCRHAGLHGAHRAVIGQLVERDMRQPRIPDVQHPRQCIVTRIVQREAKPPGRGRDTEIERARLAEAGGKALGDARRRHLPRHQRSARIFQRRDRGADIQARRRDRACIQRLRGRGPGHEPQACQRPPHEQAMGDEDETDAVPRHGTPRQAGSSVRSHPVTLQRVSRQGRTAWGMRPLTNTARRAFIGANRAISVSGSVGW